MSVNDSIVFSYVINRWFGDHRESDFLRTTNTTNKATLLQPASTRPLTTYQLTVKTSIRPSTSTMLTPSIYIFFVGPNGSSPVIHLNALSNRTDLFQSLEIDEFSLTIPDTDMVLILIDDVSLTSPLARDHAHLEYGEPCTVDMRIRGHHEHDQLQTSAVRSRPHSLSPSISPFSFPVGIELQNTGTRLASHIDLEAEIGRVFVDLPGPRSDAAYPTYRLILQTVETKGLDMYIQLRGDAHRSQVIPLNESSKSDTPMEFHLYGLCSLGEVSSWPSNISGLYETSS